MKQEKTAIEKSYQEIHQLQLTINHLENELSLREQDVNEMEENHSTKNQVTKTS